MSTPSGEMFVDFPMYPVINIGSTPTLVFQSDYICILQSIKFVNITTNTIKVFAYILRDLGGGDTETYPYANGIPIESLGRIDLLENSLENIKPGDTLYSYSDFSNNKFNCFISYQALIQT